MIDKTYDRSIVKIVDGAGKELTLPRVYASNQLSIYELVGVNGEGKLECRTITIDSNDEWTYKSTVIEGTAELDNKYVKLDENSHYSADFNAIATDLGTTSISSSDNKFPYCENIRTEVNKYVLPSRKVNSKQLNADITLSADDVGCVPTSRKIGGKALTGDITLGIGDIKNAKRLYLHNITVKDGNNTFASFQIWNTTSTAYTTNTAISNALINAGYDSSRYLESYGTSGGVSNYSAVYGVKDANFKYYRGPSNDWGNGTWNGYADKVLTLI